MVKTLNSGLKGTGLESYPDLLCFFLEQENLLPLLHSTQVIMGTWQFGSFVLSKNKIVKSPNRRMRRPMCYVFATGWGSNVCKRLEHGYAVDKRYINAIFTLLYFMNQITVSVQFSLPQPI